VNALSLRLAKLEGPRVLVAHRPDGLASHEFLTLIVRTLAAVPVAANPTAYDAAVEAAVGPWLRAVTPEEAKDILDGISAIEKARQAAGSNGSRQIGRN
jgi:hypothetical protein